MYSRYAESKRFRKTLAAVRVAVQEATANGHLPAFLAELELVRVEGVLAAARPAQGPPMEAERRESRSRLLSVQEAADSSGGSKGGRDEPHRAGAVGCPGSIPDAVSACRCRKNVRPLLAP